MTSDQECKRLPVAHNSPLSAELGAPRLASEMWDRARRVSRIHTDWFRGLPSGVNLRATCTVQFESVTLERWSEPFGPGHSRHHDQSPHRASEVLSASIRIARQRRATAKRDGRGKQRDSAAARILGQGAEAGAAVTSAHWHVAHVDSTIHGSVPRSSRRIAMSG
jgi:hypothetical protein